MKMLMMLTAVLLTAWSARRIGGSHEESSADLHSTGGGMVHGRRSVVAMLRRKRLGGG
jgi:hypothetical protein